MLTTLAVGIAIIVTAVLILAAQRPDTFRIARTATVKAPPEALYAQIVDFRNWLSWSPFEKYDPNLQRTHSGTARGPGAVYEWKGNAKAGAGRMEIVSAALPGKITIKLDFRKPFEAHNIAEFILVPVGDATEITWAMQGSTPFFGKIIHVFFDMDRMVGRSFEEGLAKLKALVETR